MESEADNAVLRILAEGGSMEYEQWPALLPRVLSRLDTIIKDEFPTPTYSVPSSQPVPSSPPVQSTAGEASSQTSTQSTTKDTSSTPPTLPPVVQSLIQSVTSTLITLFTEHPPHTIQRLAELLLYPSEHYRTLPSYLHALDRVVHVTSGAQIFPLPPAVPEPSSLAVLSNGATDLEPVSTSWGRQAQGPPTLGSDESLGGALLTPIPWLNRNGTGTHSPMEREVKTESTEMIEGPNGPGGIETVSVSVNGISSTIAASADPDMAVLRAEGGITQGELLRQEQRAGVVPAAQLHGNRGDTDGLGEDDEMPHARGPDDMTVEDMGPQGHGSSTGGVGHTVGMVGIDIEAAVGRKLEPARDEEMEDAAPDVEPEVKAEEESESKDPEPPTTPKREAEEELAGEGKKAKVDDEPAAEQLVQELKEVVEKEDEEMETVDLDGNTEADLKEKEEEKGDTDTKEAEATV